MARPRKMGLDYFGLDVDIFEDDKLFDIQNQFGPLGESIYLRLLCWVYKSGYYYDFHDIDTLVARLIKSIGNRWIGNKETVKQVIRALGDANLFDIGLIQANVITSRSCQHRYLKMCERRQLNIDKKYWLLADAEVCFPDFGVSVDNNAVNVCNNSINVDDNATKLNYISKLNNSNTKDISNRTAGELKIDELERQWIEKLESSDAFGDMMQIYLKGNQSKEWHAVMKALLSVVLQNKDITLGGEVVAPQKLKRIIYDLSVTDLAKIVIRYKQAHDIVSPPFYIAGIAYNIAKESI